MKKFYTIIPMQVGEKLGKYRYSAVDNPRLDMETEVSFPILTAVNGYVEPGEEFKVIAVVNSNAASISNLEVFHKELSDVCKAKGCPVPVITVISIEEDSSVSAMADLFSRLIDCAEDEDEVYASLTFGTKMQSEILGMAVRYSCRIMKDSCVGCLVYGEIRRPSSDKSTWSGKVYDVTLFSQLDDVVRMLADRKSSNPREFIRRMMEL